MNKVSFSLKIIYGYLFPQESFNHCNEYFFLVCYGWMALGLYLWLELRTPDAQLQSFEWHQDTGSSDNYTFNYTVYSLPMTLESWG